MVAAPEHRFAKLAAVPIAQLASEPLVHYNPGNGFGVWVDQFAARNGVVLPEPTLRTGSPRTAAQLAAAGMGIAIVPFSALARGQAARSGHSARRNCETSWSLLLRRTTTCSAASPVISSAAACRSPACRHEQNRSGP